MRGYLQLLLRREYPPIEERELQRVPTFRQEWQNTALQGLFGLDQEQLALWPGSAAYCAHLEKHFSILLSQEFGGIWTALQRQQPTQSQDCWPYFTDVCSALQGLEDEKATIEDVWTLLSPKPNDHGAHTSSSSPTIGFLAVFAVLCWTTMTVQPILNFEDEPNGPSLMAWPHRDASPISQRMDNARRPMTAVFRGFRTSAWQTNQEPIGAASHNQDLLYASSLNYWSLKQIGKIHIEWVETLAAHLTFDSRSRCLRVFRFPTFCALATQRVKPHKVLQCICKDWASTSNNVEQGPTSLEQEILLSYRLLFGQSGRSRRLMQTELRKLRSPDLEYDELLGKLCTCRLGRSIRKMPQALWPFSCRDAEGHLQEQDAYSVDADFPLLGRRLLKLQLFNLRQQPSRVRDLWRDRRHPAQWYTFWAVLLIGIPTLVLAFVQAAIAAAQLAVAIHSPNNQAAG